MIENEKEVMEFAYRDYSAKAEYYRKLFEKYNYLAEEYKNVRVLVISE